MGTPEAFAAAFLTAAETGMLGVESPDYTGDSRTRRIGRALRAAGVHEVEILGGGSFGMAGATQDGRVVKLTTDESEVEAGLVLRGQHLPHVVHIDGSWFVRRTRAVKWNTGVEHRVGMLLMERVEPVGAAPDGNAVTIVWSKVRETYNATPWKLVKMNRADARATLYAASKALERQLRDIGSKLAVDVADGLRELRDHKVYGIDVHAGNIGYSARDGVYKLFDIGASSSPDTANPGELPLETETAPRGMTEEGVRVEEIGGEGPASIEILRIATDKLIVSRSSMSAALWDVMDGRTSRTTGPLDVWHKPEFQQRPVDGDMLTDGHHRLVETLLRGHVDAIEARRVGSGYSDYWATPSPEDRFVFTDSRYGGLESLADEKLLRKLKAPRVRARIDPVIVPIDRMYWHGTASRARLLPRRLRGPMWFAKSRHRAVEFGGKLHCFETTRPLQLFPINDSTRDALPMDDSILLPHDRLIDAIRASGYDGSIMYAGDSSEEIMLLEPSRTMRQCDMVNAARESHRKARGSKYGGMVDESVKIEEIGGEQPHGSASQLAEEDRRTTLSPRIDELVTKYMAILGVTQRPRIEIHDNVGSKWLGRCIWTTRDPSTSTIELQKSILRDDRTLERIIAHEMVHHRDFMAMTQTQISMLSIGIRPEAHGDSFRQGAALINDAMGPDFVTKTSDQQYVQAPTRPFYVLIGRQADAFGFRGIPAEKYGYKWAVRLSDQAKKIINVETSLGARLVVTTNERWAHGRAKITPYAGWNIPSTPEGQAELKALYDSADEASGAAEASWWLRAKTRRIDHQYDSLTPQQLAALPDGEIELVPTDVLDLAAFGFKSGDVVDVPIAMVHVHYDADIANARAAVRTQAQAHAYDDAPPVDITVRNDTIGDLSRKSGARYDLEDGHHRYVAARVLHKPTIKATIDVAANPILELRRKYCHGAAESCGA